MEILSEDYGIVRIETNPTPEKTKDYTSLIRKQVLAQTFKENLGKNANVMFHFGLRWGRTSGMFKQVPIKAFGGTANYYGYDTQDQNGNDLPPLSDLQPIIDELEANLGIDMSDYDSMIGNIYLENQYIYPHRDTTESSTARNYPVIVYTIGNDSSLGIWDNNKGKMTFVNSYDLNYAPKKQNVHNEILTKNGTIYTFGLEGKGRFELVHSTPCLAKKPLEFPKLLLPNLDVITKYTITLTFRRAKDLDETTPITPKRLNGK